MRLRTTWTMPGMRFREKLNRTWEWLALKIAAHLPKQVRYWAALLEIGKATRDSPNIPSTTLDDILKNMSPDEKIEKG